MLDSRAQLTYNPTPVAIMVVGIIAIIVYDAVVGQLPNVGDVWGLVAVLVIVFVASLVISPVKRVEKEDESDG